MRIFLDPVAAGIAGALEPLTGRDEAAFAAGSGAQASLALLGRLAGRDILVLTVSDADRLLAALYERVYGASAECAARCAACGKPFEFTLDLDAVMTAQDAERPGPPAEDGGWTLPDGRRARAPTIGDLAEPAHLAARLMLAGAHDAAVDDWLDRAAPLLSIDLDAACPECGAANAVRFDLATFFAARLAAERPFLTREIHLIATRYGWSRAEIVALTRDERRAYAALIEGERAAALRPLRRAS